MPTYYSHALRAEVQIAPGAPTGLVIAGCGSTALLSWSAPTSTGYASELRYEVRRDGATIATAATAPFTDPAAPAATATYEVLAVNDGGASAPASISWSAPPCPPVTTTSTAVGPTSSSTTTSTVPAARAAAVVVAQPRLAG